MKWYFFQHDKRKKFPVMKLINLLFPRQSQLILTPYSSLVKVSFYLVSAIGKLKVGKKLPNFGFVTNIRSSRPEVFCKKGILRDFAKFTGKHLCQSLFFNEESLAQVLSCELCEISKNTVFYRTPLVAASVIFLYRPIPFTNFFSQTTIFNGLSFCQPKLLLNNCSQLF